LAQKTDGFSGADLQALLYTTQLIKINQRTGRFLHKSNL
jgi:hypothetical protein